MLAGSSSGTMTGAAATVAADALRTMDGHNQEPVSVWNKSFQGVEKKRAVTNFGWSGDCALLEAMSPRGALPRSLRKVKGST